MSTLNNENEFRVTRSRTKGSDNSKASLAAPANPIDASSRQYLGDVSHEFGIPRPAAQPTTRKRPLAESLNARASASHAEIARAKDVRLKTATSLISLQLIPHRLPQKRQATESSTNLVEKLHHESDDDSSIKFKKSKRTDYEWQDLDEEDFDDPLMVSEYVNEIFPYLHELEKKTLPDRNYLFNQTQLKPKMRSILVDWLVEMHQRFRLLPETLFLAINIMDRFMSMEVVQIDKLQLLATGSLFIAAKYEEVFSPSVKNYAYYTDGSYTEDEILQAEKYILTILNFDLGYPNPMNFLRRISKADDYDVQLRTLGKFLLEITIVDHRFIGMLPSLCSAAAMYIARLVLGKDPVWNGNLIHYSGGYRIDDMKECVELIVQYLVSPVEHDEFFKKYATRKFMKASIICRSWAKNFVNDRKDLFDERLLTEKINK